MEMVSAADYLTAVSLSLDCTIQESSHQLSHEDAKQLALIICSSDLPKNIHAAAALLYMWIMHPVDSRLRIK